MDPAKPSLELLRSLTDEHVLRALIAERRLTRAEIAARTGISKPTVSESARRLTEAGLLRDTGERTTGRGRVGTYYALAEDLGFALVVGIAPEGVVAEAVDVHGEVIAREVEEVGRPAHPDDVARALRAVAERARRGGSGPARLAVVSAADPVDRGSGRLVHLPDAPFLVGELSPVEVLAPLVAGSITVDNDINWAARAERSAAGPGELDDFVYVHLGEGLGCAVVNDGEVRRGHAGLVGEIAHVVTVGPQGRVIPLTEVFDALGVRRTGTTAIDATALLAVVARSDAKARRVLTTLSRAISGVLAAAVAFADPELIVIGGAWGTAPAVLDAIAADFDGRARHVPVRPALLTHEAALAGARNEALSDLRSRVADEPRSSSSPSHDEQMEGASSAGGEEAGEPRSGRS
jgi:predicted NBD/HSP70 family sugar kinase